MRKSLLALAASAALIMLAGLTVTAQPRTFLGLTLGESYTENEVRDIIPVSTGGFYTVTKWEDNSESESEMKKDLDSPQAAIPIEDIMFSVFATAQPIKKDIKHPEYVFFFNSKGKLRMVSLSYNMACGLPSVIYKHLADSLSAIYPMQALDYAEGLQYKDGKLDITLMKYVHPEGDFVGVSYLDLSYGADPVVQDTFLGMKMEQKYTVERVKSIVGMKGVFSKSERTATGTELIFTKLAYAGKLWDYGHVMLSNEGEFSAFSIYDSLEDDSDERKDAKSIYESYKKSLDKKYGSTIYPVTEEDGNDVSSLYLGSNGIGVELFNRCGKTERGFYRRFVGMNYVHMGILNRNQAATEDEL